MFSAAKRATEPATGTGNGKRRTLRKFTLRIEWETLAWSLGPIINGPVKLFFVYMKDRSFNSLAFSHDKTTS